MNIGENIHNAFDIVGKTYEQVDRMIKDCMKYAENDQEFVCCTPKFLRYKSDTDYWGWYTWEMFLVFKSNNPKQRNSLFVMDINLYDDYDEPMLVLAKFQYDDISKVEDKLSMGYYYIFHRPLYDEELDYFLIDGCDNCGVAEIPKEKSDSSKYQGVQRIAYKEIPLIQVNSENLYDSVFGSFKMLESI